VKIFEVSFHILIYLYMSIPGAHSTSTSTWFHTMFVELALWIQEFRSLIPVTAVCKPFPWHTITIIKVVYIQGAEFQSLARNSFIPLHNNVGADSDSSAWDKLQECPVSCSYYISYLLKKKPITQSCINPQSFIRRASWNTFISTSPDMSTVLVHLSMHVKSRFH
jgi:hypothetical protein